MSTRNYGLVRTAAEFLTHVRRLMQTPDIPVGFDIEAGYTGEDKEGVSLLPHHPDWILVGFSFTNGKDWARYVPIAHDNGDNVDDVKAVARILWRLLNTCKIIPHNANYELTGVSRWFMETLADDPKVGDEVRAKRGFYPIWSDSYIEAKVLNQYDPLRVGAGLKGLSKHVLGQEMTEFRDLFPPDDTDMGPGTPKSKLKYIRFNTRYPDSPRIINYTCEDSTAAWELSDRHLPQIAESEMNFIYQIEMRLLPILVAMEFEGLALDWPEIHKRSLELDSFQADFNEEIQREFARRTGNAKPVLLTSPKQLGEVLFNPVEDGGLGLPVRKRSDKTQAPSTADDALGVIAQKDQIIRDILTYRRVAKLQGSYLRKYDTELNYAGNGRAYPNHNQIGAGTGRMSVDGVSYQQWPKPYHFELRSGRTFDLNFRDLLISPPGYRIVGFDYSQIELRVMAGQAGEDTMIQAFIDDVDIHRATASTMLRVPLSDITKKQRGVGKTSNFAVVYQSGAENIADMLTAQGSPTTKEEAEQMLRDYFAAFPKLRAYMDGLQRTGSEQKFVSTPFGRRFTIWEYHDPRPFIRAKGDRLCVNAPIQGGAADYMKIGLVRAWNAIQKAGLGDKIRLVMSVHDALEFYVADDVDDQTVIDLIDPMVAFDHPVMKGVPIRADWHVGQKWGHVVEIKRDKETGRITGYVNEDDDQVFDTAEAAYARGLQIDEDKEKANAARISERLEAEAAKAESGEQSTPSSEFTGSLTDLFEKHNVEERLRDEILAACEKDADTPDEEVKAEAARIGGWDLIFSLHAKAVSDASVLDDLEAIASAAPEPAKAEKPSKEDHQPMALQPLDRFEELRRDHNSLVSEFYLRYHRESAPGETVREWIEREGIRPEDAFEEVPPWASDRGIPEGVVVEEPAAPEQDSEPEMVLIVVEEMPDADTYEVFLRWLEKYDEHGSARRVVLSTPEGEVEVRTSSGSDSQLGKAARLVDGTLVINTPTNLREMGLLKEVS